MQIFTYVCVMKRFSLVWAEVSFLCQPPGIPRWSSTRLSGGKHHPSVQSNNTHQSNTTHQSSPTPPIGPTPPISPGQHHPSVQHHTAIQSNKTFCSMHDFLTQPQVCERERERGRERNWETEVCKGVSPGSDTAAAASCGSGGTLPSYSSAPGSPEPWTELQVCEMADC